MSCVRHNPIALLVIVAPPAHYRWRRRPRKCPCCSSAGQRPEVIMGIRSARCWRCGRRCPYMPMA